MRHDLGWTIVWDKVLMADDSGTESPVRVGINPDDPLIMKLQSLSRDGDHLVKELVILINLVRQLLYLLGHPMRD